MKRIGIARSESTAALGAGERSTIAALNVLGYSADVVNWSAPDVNWGAYSAVLVHACWDYHLTPRAFLDWAQRLEDLGVLVLNPVEILRWNHHKGYLLALRDAGVPVIPTILLSDRNRDVAQAAATLGAAELVIKPAVSASAMHTYRVAAADAATDPRVVKLVASTDAIVQPYLPQIINGEASLIFVDGLFSHAVLKRPAAGDFRVQSEHGGLLDALSPPEWLIAAARHVIDAAPRLPVYARVDGLVLDRTLLLMELELIEPELFLHLSEGSALRLARAIVGRLSSNHEPSRSGMYFVI